MAAALQELISQNDSSGSEKDQASGGGESTGAFLDVIHLLTKMASGERAALIGLLKALG